MKPYSFPLSAALALFFASGAGASTLVDLVCSAEVLQAGEYMEDSESIDIVVLITGVDQEASATGYFAGSFMEHWGSFERCVSLEGVSAEDAALLTAGSMISVNYWSVSCLLQTDDGDWEGYSDESWTLVGMEI